MKLPVVQKVLRKDIVHFVSDECLQRPQKGLKTQTIHFFDFFDKLCTVSMTSSYRSSIVVLKQKYPLSRKVLEKIKYVS